MVSVPMMTVVAVAGFNASSGPGLGLIPSAEAAQGEAEGAAKGEGEAEGRAEGEAEGRAEGEGEAEGEAEGEGVSAKLKKAVRRPEGYTPYNATFKNEYPHAVAMGKRDFGMDMVYLDEMVQICMVAPMAAEPLEWGSEELAALTEYSRVQQKEFIDKQ